MLPTQSGLLAVTWWTLSPSKPTHETKRGPLVLAFSLVLTRSENMKLLRAIPFWGWFVINLVIAYGVWNPWGFSLYDMWVGASRMPTSAKLIITLIVGAFIMLLVTETYRSLGRVGLFVYLAIVAAILWLCYDLGWLSMDNLDSAQYWAQIPIAFLLTLGSQATKLYRAATGRVGVDDPDTVAPDDAS